MASRLRVIHGGEENPRPDDAETMWFCPKCNGHLVNVVKAGMTWKRGKIRGGETVKVCYFCSLKGEFTPID